MIARLAHAEPHPPRASSVGPERDVVVRGGHRRKGCTTPLIEGAVAWAAECGAPAVESYPVDAGGDRIDVTMAFVGTRVMFEKAGFGVVGTTDATGSGRPRIVMRRTIS